MRNNPSVAYFFQNGRFRSKGMDRLSAPGTCCFRFFPNDCNISYHFFGVFKHLADRGLRKCNIAAQVVIGVLISRVLYIARLINRNILARAAQVLQLCRLWQAPYGMRSAHYWHPWPQALPWTACIHQRAVLTVLGFLSFQCSLGLVKGWR